MNDSLIHVRPGAGTLHVSRGRTVLVTASDGSIGEEETHGLFVHNTRLVSRHRIRVDGEPMQPVALSNVEQHAWMGYYVIHPPGVDPGPPERGSGQVPPLARDTLELRLSRVVGEGMHEDVDLANYSRHHTRFTLAVELDGDFREQVHPRGLEREPHTLERAWQSHGAGGRLVLIYQAHNDWEHQGSRGRAHVRRELHLIASPVDSQVSWDGTRLQFAIELAPGARWHGCLRYVPVIDGQVLDPPESCRAAALPDEYQHFDARFLEAAARFRGAAQGTLSPVVMTTLERARRDLVALRLHDLDDDHGWTIAAGVPTFVALFGRDVLTASWQAAMLGPEMMHGALRVLAERQGRQHDDWTDEQPGRMLHEEHTGPLEVLRYTPRARNYGSVTTSGFYPVVVSELWHWTGDRALVEPFIEPALRALAWLDREADRDGDGFYEYRTRSADGVKHQAWKDSPDAIVAADGTPVEPPIATCEEQAFAYVAKLHLSEVLWWLDRPEDARRLFREAAELKARFNDAFWMAEEGTFALGLDAAAQPIRSITSNPGHLLAAGIVATEHAGRTAARLMSEDMFSGWGVRTLSAAHPSYNPYSYHRGAVWPVENGTFALGFMRYGLHDHVERLARAQFEAAGLFHACRLPEAFSGHPRDAAHPFPALYPRANAPQAWSASAVFCLLQAMLGLYPYAPLALLLVDPHLPPWLPQISVQGLRVGGARAHLRFFRTASGETDYEVVSVEGTLHVVRQPSPWSLTATSGERLRDVLTSMLPGR